MHHEHATHADQPRTARAVAIGVLCCALLALLPAAAHATAGLNVSPVFPTPVSVGSSSTASLLLTNTNTGVDGSSTVCNFNDAGPCAGSNGVTFVPSCSALDFSATCTPAGASAGVFTIASTATGAAGSACAGMSFAVTVIDVTFGTVRFTPTSGNIVLPTPGSTCNISFGYTVVARPAVDARVAPGRQTLQSAEAASVSDQGSPAFVRTAGAAVTVTLAAPSVTDSDPNSPANDNAPKIKGTAPADTQTVAVYTNAACSGAPEAQGTAADFASPGLTVSHPDDTTRTYFASGTDAEGGVSPCSASGLTYVEDSTPPPAPTLTDTDPNSPSNDDAPRVKGTAAAGSTVRIYTTANCSGSFIGGSAANFASPGLLVPVSNDATTTFYATATDAAGNTSACSPTSISYVEDSTPPSAPSVTATTPASPSNDASPRVRGSATAGSTVRVYTNAACSGGAAASGSAADYGTPGIQVPVSTDGTTTFYTTATDAAGNESACSPSGVSYVRDTVAPAPPTLAGSQPASPSSDNSPRIRGGADSGSTVRLYTDPACSSAVAAEGSAAAYAAPGLVVTVADDSATTYYARATDAAGNPSLCSASGVSYVEDSKSPTTSIDGAPTGPPSTPTYTFSSSEPGSTFECRIDSGAFAPCTSPYTVAAGLPAGTHTFEVRAVDAAGNRAASVSRSFTVTASAVPPPPPPAAAPRAQPGCLNIKGTVYVGTSGANTRTGGARTDIMFGLGGNDSLRGGAGVDCLYGAAGRDVLRGGGGADRLFGGTSHDRLLGDAGNDRLSGQGGNDRLNGGTGTDTLAGAAGRDVLTDRRGRDRFSGGAGVDRIDARDTRVRDRAIADRILCGPGRDIVYADPRDRVARDCERVVKRSLGPVYRP